MNGGEPVAGAARDAGLGCDRRRRPVRPRLRGVAAQPRGDAPARRRPAGAAAPDRASRGRGRRQRPLGLPRRSMAPVERHAAELPHDRVRVRGRCTSRDPAAEHAPSRDRRAGVRRARPGAVALGPRDAHRVDAGRERRLDRAARTGRGGRGSTRRRGRSGGRSGSPRRRFRGDIDAFDAYWAEMLDPAGPVQVGPLARELAGVDPATAACRAPSAGCPSRPPCTTGPCGRRSVSCRQRSARPTACRGTPGIAWSPIGSWPAGEPGARCCRPASARCPRPSPPTAVSRGGRLSRSAGTAGRRAC